MRFPDNNRGGAIVQVIILTTAITILLTVLLNTQYRTTPNHKLQALSNARSAILMTIANENRPKVKAFKAESSHSDSIKDTSYSLWGTALEKKFGTAEISTTPTAFSIQYEALGIKEDDTARVLAECGTLIPLGDTTVVLLSKDEIEGKELISGEIIQEDSLGLPRTFQLDKTGLSKAKKTCDSLIMAIDSISPGPTISIFNASDFTQVSTEIGSDLFLDGTNLIIDAKGKTYVITGDLQLTGEVILKNGTFIVGGEVRVNDLSKVTHSDLFIKGNLFLSHESQFSGRAIAYGAIEILDNVTISDKSLIISFHKGKKSKSSCYVRGNSKIDATIFSTGPISTEEMSESKGVLYSQDYIEHKGYHSGLIVAKRLGKSVTDSTVTSSDAKSNKPQPLKDSTKAVGQLNKLEGSITDLFSETSYPLPWFIGNKQIIEWREFN